MPTEILAELTAIINLLEADIPASPNSPKNQKLKKRLEGELVKYFDKLEHAFPYSKIASIYNKHVVKESLGSETKGILDPLLAAFDSTLTTMFEGQLSEIYISGQAEMITWGKTKAGVPIAYEGPPISQAVNWAKDHGATLVKGLDDETKKRLAHTISQGIQNKRGIPGLSRDIRNTFADMSKHRSELIARTETANALSTASIDNMEGMGIDGKEWVTAGDSDVSEECEGNEAQGVIPRGDTFSGGTSAPPQHPDAVFEGYNFYPYGALTQMVGSRYDGPAITFEAERIEDAFELPPRDTGKFGDGSNGDTLVEHRNSGGDLLIRNRSGKTVAIFPKRVQLTIGPNHPVLTRRGFINAQFLNEGDELLYDGRCELSTGVAEPYFKQIHIIEDIFEAVASISDYADIPAAGDYFHGDETFCYGEVKVIRPERHLLFVSDTSIIEHLSKCNLTGAYADAEHVASCSSCQSALNSVFSPSTSSVGSSNHIISHLSGETSPPFFHSYRLFNTHKTSYIGRALDASTSTELYSIGGLVVKNCRCSISPAMLPKK